MCVKEMLGLRLYICTLHLYSPTVEKLVEDADDEFFRRVMYNDKHVLYTHCCLTETSTVMNCRTFATNSLLHPVTINETLFTDNYTKTSTNTPSPFVSVSLILFNCVLSIHNKRIRYVMLCYVMCTDGTDVPLLAWTSTSVPRRSRHSCSHRSCIATSATFRQPTPAHCASLSTQHVRSSGFSGCWSDALELIANAS